MAKHDLKKEMEKKARLQKLQGDLLKKMPPGVTGKNESITTPERKQGTTTPERKQVKINAVKHEGITSEKITVSDTAPAAAADAQKLSAEWLSRYNNSSNSRTSLEIAMCRRMIH